MRSCCFFDALSRAYVGLKVYLRVQIRKRVANKHDAEKKVKEILLQGYLITVTSRSLGGKPYGDEVRGTDGDN